jgi:TolB protein
MARRPTLYLPVMIVAALMVASAVALLAVSQKAEATFPDKNGRIAYSAFDLDGGVDETIYTIKPGGGGRQPLTDNSSDDRSPSYSPSGKKIAFQGYDGNDNEIYTINPGGGGRTPVTDNGTRDFEPYWGSQ